MRGPTNCPVSVSMCFVVAKFSCDIVDSNFIYIHVVAVFETIHISCQTFTDNTVFIDDYHIGYGQLPGTLFKATV